MPKPWELIDNIEDRPAVDSGRARVGAAVNVAPHTPGPWLTDQTSVYSADRMSWGIADCSTLRKRTDPHGPLNVIPGYAECEANARLVAAAPEMLAVLTFIFEHIADKDRTVRDLYPAFGLNAGHAVEMTRAAIAKASGL